MKLSLDVHRIQPIHTMEKNNHLKEQDEEIKIPKQNTASPIPHSNQIPYEQLFTVQVEITRSSFKKNMSALVYQKAQTNSNHLDKKYYLLITIFDLRQKEFVCLVQWFSTFFFRGPFFVAQKFCGPLNFYPF